MKRFLLASTIALCAATTTGVHAADGVPDLLGQLDADSVRSLTVDEKTAKRGEYFRDSSYGRYRNTSTRYRFKREDYDAIRTFCSADAWAIRDCSYRGNFKPNSRGDWYHVVRYTRFTPVVIGAETQSPCTKGCVSYRAR